VCLRVESLYLESAFAMRRKGKLRTCRVHSCQTERSDSTPIKKSLARVGSTIVARRCSAPVHVWCIVTEKRHSSRKVVVYRITLSGKVSCDERKGEATQVSNQFAQTGKSVRVPWKTTLLQGKLQRGARGLQLRFVAHGRESTAVVARKCSGGPLGDATA
jgi:hypothetical protein